mgnify:FL=1
MCNVADLFIFDGIVYLIVSIEPISTIISDE